jgi:Ca2+:H+ antiporter
MPSESSPLIPVSNGNVSRPSRFQVFKGFFKSGEDEPSFAQSYKYFWFGKYLNLFLVFVPLSAIAHHLNWDSTLRFMFSFFAIVPLASVRRLSLFIVEAVYLISLVSLSQTAFGRGYGTIVNQARFNPIWVSALWTGEMYPHRQRILTLSCLVSLTQPLAMLWN